MEHPLCAFVTHMRRHTKQHGVMMEAWPKRFAQVAPTIINSRRAAKIWEKLIRFHD